MQVLDLGKLMYQQLHADFGLITFMKKSLIYITLHYITFIALFAVMLTYA
jgi:hypothetical protein